MQHIHKTSMRIRALLVFTPVLTILALTAYYIGIGKELVDFFEAYRLDHPHLTLAVTIFTHTANPIMYVIYGYMLWKAYKKMDAEQGRIVKRRVFSYLFVQILISFALTRGLKMAFGMPRPDIGGPMTPFTLDHGHHSFPSGHTTEIVGATLPLAWWAKSFLPSIAIGIYVASVAYSRIYLGSHHILDVVAGLLLGSFAAWCIHRLAQRKTMSEQKQSTPSKAVVDPEVPSDATPTSNTAVSLAIQTPQVTDAVEKNPEIKEKQDETISPKPEPIEEVIPEPTSAQETELAPITDTVSNDTIDDWAKAQVDAGLIDDGKLDANGNLETWSDGVRTKQYNSTPDLDLFKYTQSQPSNFGHPLPQEDEQNTDADAIANADAQDATLGEAQAVNGVQTGVSRRFSGLKGFKRSYGPQATQTPDVPLEPSLATSAFDFFANWPILVLTSFLILQVVGGIVDCRALWFSDEIRHAAVYEHMIASAFGSADWVILQLNGVPYPDKPAVYFWFLALLDCLPHVDMPMLFMLGTGISALFMLWATYALARVTGNDRNVSLAAGFVLLTTFYFIGVTHYGRMDLLFAATITASQICMYQGWKQDKAMFWRIMAFVLAGVATLIKGPIGLALPIISAIVFIIWQGKWRRLNTRDGAFGFGIMLCILLAWVTLIWAYGGNDYLRSIFDDQIVKRAVDTWHHKQAWWHYLATLPLAWLPWTFIILVLPWFAWLRNPLSPILASRHGENLGAAFLWICVITGLAFLSALSGKIVIYLLPLFPMIAILTARGIMSLSHLGSKVLYSLFALLFLLLGWIFTAIAIFPYAKPFLEMWDTTGLLAQIPAQVMAYIIAIEGAGILAAVCFMTGIALFAWVDRRQARGALLVTTIFMTLLIQPLSVYTAKSLDSIMSPKEQAEIMAAYVDDGYTPMTYRVFPGTYTYYANVNTLDIQDDNWESLEQAIEGKEKVALAMRLSDWEKWPNRPAAMQEIHRQWIVDRPFVLVVLDTRPEPVVDIVVSQAESIQARVETE